MGLFTAEKRRNLMLLPLTKRGDADDTFEGGPAGYNGKGPDNDQGGEFDDPRKILKPLKALYITGHSLGGAMAALAAAQIHSTSSWREVRDNMFGCYTYGAPMVAAPPLAKQLEKEIGHLVYRHVYAFDVVPQLPPQSTGAFQHFGQEYRCMSNGDGWLAQTPARMQTRYVGLLPIAGLAMVLEQFPRLRSLAAKLPISIDHHSPRHYMRVSEQSRTSIF
jgi:hypothetical protein